MEVYRLSREKYAYTLSGYGASIKGARWNSMGVEMIYTAMNRSLAMAEVAVHLSWASLPTDYMMLTIEIPNELAIQEVQPYELPKGWNIFPHPKSTQSIGDKFVFENKVCLLKVPSVVTQGDYNLLINPRHADFSKIRISRREQFPFDSRLFQ